MEKLNATISLPCLRGKMGDSFFYSTLMSFKEVASRIKLPEEIDKKYASSELKLGDWIQRKIEKNRISNIVSYIRNQEQRFFNSIIVGIFDGSPSWQDINVKNPEIADIINDNTLEYLNRTFGVLTLNGEESLFAIDGQHRALSIREAVKGNRSLEGDEISIIFVAHQSTEEGKVRTRRLFSTLNKYAKPVSASEIIALSEDNNCAVITRGLIETFDLFKDKVLINKNRSINVENSSSFTNIMVLYDLVERLLTDKSVYGIKVSGYKKDQYITSRVSDEQLAIDIKRCEKDFRHILTAIPSLNKFFEQGKINRKLKNSSLLFRPIGQNVLFDVYKVAAENNKKNAAINFFKKDDFNLNHRVWRKVFLDEETDNISPEKSKQRYAALLILEHIGVDIKRTVKDQDVYDRYKIKCTDI